MWILGRFVSIIPAEILFVRLFIRASRRKEPISPVFNVLIPRGDLSRERAREVGKQTSRRRKDNFPLPALPRDWLKPGLPRRAEGAVQEAELIFQMKRAIKRGWT